MLGKRQNALITLNSSHLALTGLASSASIGDKSVMKMLVSKGNGTQSSKRTSPSCRRMRNRGRIRAASEQGSALVEFALVMPIFLTVVFGMCSFGFLINEYLQLTEVCNIGAEQLALTRSQSDPCQVVYNDVVQVSPHLNAPAMIFTFTLNGTVARAIYRRSFLLHCRGHSFCESQSHRSYPRHAEHPICPHQLQRLLPDQPGADQQLLSDRADYGDSSMNPSNESKTP